MRRQKNPKQTLSKLTITLLAISTLVLVLATIPGAKAGDQSIMLSPAQGPVNTFVNVMGMGFPSGNRVEITFESKQVGSAYPGMFGRISATFQVPNLPLGTYTVTATSPAGSSATATFAITEKGAPPSTSTSSGSTASLSLSANKGTAGTTITVSGPGFSAGSNVDINFNAVYQAGTKADGSGRISCTLSIPSAPPGTYTISATSITHYASAPFTITSSTQGTGSNQNKATTENAGFWSPATIALIGAIAAAAIILPLMFIYRGRGKKETLPPSPSQDRPVYQPKPPPQPKQPLATSLYDRPTSYTRQANQKTMATTVRTPPASYYTSSQPLRKPTVTPAYQTASSYKPQTAATRTCRHCKQTVPDDYNICPNCHKRLR